MKHLRLVLVLVALLGLAGFMFAQQRSSSAVSQGQQNAATQSTQSSWYCPMASNSGWMNRMHNYMMGRSGSMMGNGYGMHQGMNGQMGPGMMYGYRGNMMTGHNGMQQTAPDQNQQVQPKK